jgi:hypothetical protein
VKGNLYILSFRQLCLVIALSLNVFKMDDGPFVTISRIITDLLVCRKSSLLLIFLIKV